MTQKNFLLGFILCLFSVSSAFAQAVVTDANAYNDKINGQIGNSSLHVHQVTLNIFDKPIAGYGKYRETINYYFKVTGKKSSLKKIIVTSDVAKRKTYIDFLYDAKGNITKYEYNENVLDADSDKLQCYFIDKQLKYIARSGEEPLSEDELGTKDVETGVEAMSKAIRYKSIFDAMLGVQIQAK